jgi:hypothetical protein
MCSSILKTYIKRPVNLFRCFLLHTFLPIPKGSEGRIGVSSTSFWYTGRSRFKSRFGDRLFCSHIHAFVSRFWIVSQIREYTLRPTFLPFHYSLILSFIAKPVQSVPASHRVYLWVVRSRLTSTKWRTH